MGARPPVLALREIRRNFGRVRALDGVSFSVAAGEVVAVLGENGAGKSTLMNVLFGLCAPDAGIIEMDAAIVRIPTPRHARALGIGMVHQHFALAPGLTVAENFALDEGGWRLLHFDRARSERQVAALAEEIGFSIDPGARISGLSVGDRQRAEILKALKGDVRLLILDEPTATLTPREIDDLLRVVRRLREGGRACLFISHKLDEVRAIAGRVVVLHRGRVVADRQLGEATSAELAGLMVGGPRVGGPAVPARVAVDPVVTESGRLPASGPVRLETRDLRVTRVADRRLAVNGVDLVVRAGEIVGITGVDGNGQSELAHALVGLRTPFMGEIRIDGSPVRLDPRRANELGFAFIPGDRRREGLIPNLDVAENLAIRHLRRAEFRHLVGARKRLLEFARERTEAFAVRPDDPRVTVGELSGGNQQRVVLARELAFAPRIVVAENPTRGLDVAAAAFVLEQLRSARRRSAAVILLSTELDDVLAIADRIFVMFRGRLTEAGGRDARSLGMLMAGVEA